MFFILNFVGNMYGTVWALYGDDAFQWNGLTVGLSLAGYGVFHAVAQAMLPGPATRRLGEKNALLIGHGLRERRRSSSPASPRRAGSSSRCCRSSRSAASAFRRCSRSTTQQVGEDKQGQLQGVMSSIVSLASIFGPLYFAGFYFGIKDWWPGLIWIIGVATYLSRFRSF